MAKEGGIIVNSSSLTPLEIAQAQSCDRFYVDENSFGFTLIPDNYKVVKAASQLIQDIYIILDYVVSDKEKVLMIKHALAKAKSQSK